MKTQLGKPSHTKTRYTEEYKEQELERRRKGDKIKVAIARWLPAETVVSLT